jgi:polyhydroxybutyrate depolymerase
MSHTILTLEVNGVRREYSLHVPPGKAHARPVVILLHGTGGTIRWTQEEARFHRFAERADFVAVIPQGLTPDPAKPHKFIDNPPMWNVGSQLFPDHRPDDLAFFRALLDDLPIHTVIDPARIYATGFSNGAAMCFELAAAFGDRIAAIAPVAGYCRATKIGRPMPTLFIIGADDPMVPPLGGTFISPWGGRENLRPPVYEGLDRWAQLLGCSVPREVVAEFNGIRTERYPGPVDFQVVTVAGLGHHWPGGLGRLKKKLAGEPSKRLNGNQTIWDFLHRHRLDGGGS